MSNARDVIVRPLVTEKTIRTNELDNTVVFEVKKGTNKVQIKQAVEEIGQFNSWSGDAFMTLVDGKWVSPEIDFVAGEGWKLRYNAGWDVNRRRACRSHQQRQEPRNGC